MAASKSLSPLEWFGLLTAVVGLVANVLYLATFALPPAAQPNSSPSIISWVALFALLCYAIVIIDVLIFRLFAKRTSDGDKLGRASMTVSLLVGMPVFTAYFIASARILRRYDPFALINLIRSEEYTPTALEANIDWAIKSFLFSAVMATVLGLAAIFILQALSGDER